MKKSAAVQTSLSVIFFLLITVSAYHLSPEEQKNQLTKWNDYLLNIAETTQEQSLTPQQVEEAIQIAKQRKPEILNILNRNPERLSQFLLNKETIHALPEEIKAFLEIPAEKEGSVIIFHIDAFEEDTSRFIYMLQTDSKKYTLFFQKDHKIPKSDERIKVRGYILDNHFFVESFEIVPQGGGASISTTGEQKVVVVLLETLDEPLLPITRGTTTIQREDLERVLQNVKEYYKEISYGKLDFSFDIIGPFTIVKNPSLFCDPNGIESQAYTLAGDTIRKYNRKMLIFPGVFCSVGSVGGFSGVSTAWIASNDLTAFTISHELGHNLGTLHANYIYCDGSKIATPQKCSSHEYGDFHDVMGNRDPTRKSLPYDRPPVHMNSLHKEMLNWLEPEKIQTITSSGIYHLDPLSVPSDEPQILKFLSQKNWYYLDYRIPVGFDNSPLFQEENKGPFLRIPFIRNGGDTQLIDTTPGDSVTGLDGRPTQEQQRSSINPGITYTDPLKKYRITTLQANTEGTDVKIELGEIATIIDNKNAEFSTTGTWNPSAIPGSYNGDSLESKTSGSTAIWTTAIWTKPFEQGYYEIYAWWTSSPERTTQAVYTIQDDIGSFSLQLAPQNQRLNGGKWNRLLVTYLSFQGTAAEVKLTVIGGSTSADAIKFVMIPSCPDEDSDGFYRDTGFCFQPPYDCDDNNENANPNWYETCGDNIDNNCNSFIDETCAQVIIDNGMQGSSIVKGSWQASTAPNSYETTSVYSKTVGNIFQWTYPSENNPNLYKIYVWWTSLSTRTQKAAYTIYDGTAPIAVQPAPQNQRLNGGKWNLLGQYALKNPIVELKVNDAYSHSADAVMFEKTSSCLEEDNDGYGPPGIITNCPYPEEDCNDGDTTINPGAKEICGDAIDQNCNPKDDACISEIILDNLQSGFSTTGTWVKSGILGYYAIDALYSKIIGSTATWQFNNLQPGKYKVYAWWTVSSGRSTNVPYTISFPGGSQTIKVNQRDPQFFPGKDWYLLGEYSFDTSAKVTMNVENTYSHNADAIKLVNSETSLCLDEDSDNYGIGNDRSGCIYESEDCDDIDPTINPGAEEICGDGKDNNCDNILSNPGVGQGEIILDNTGTNTATFSKSGSWSLSSATGSYGTQSVYSKSSGSTATWTTPLMPGEYEVYAWWTEWSSRPTEAPYAVTHTIGTTTVIKNQKEVGSGEKWNPLGKFTFEATGKVDLTTKSDGSSYNADAIKFVPAGVVCSDAQAPFPKERIEFLRGDINGDNKLDISDTITVLNFLFKEGKAISCEDAADANNDGKIDISDAIFMLSYLYQGGPALAEPFKEGPGFDPSPEDDLTCE